MLKDYPVLINGMVLFVAGTLLCSCCVNLGRLIRMLLIVVGQS